WLAHNTLASLDRHGISLDLDFLSRPANFDIGDTAWLHYSPDNSVGRAVLVGLVNTARVSVVGCVLAIGIGFVVGVLRLSHNPALRGLMRAGVELVRNTPLLLLLLLLSASLHGLPPAPSALRPIPGWYLSNRGLVLPSVGFSEITVALAVAVIVALVLRRRFGSFGWRAVSTMLIALALSLVIFRPTVETAHLNGFNFIGGTTLSPEFAALLAALVLHHAAHISEVVRGAILAVPRGVRDAARALGLSRFQTLRLVTIPLALRAMVPLLATNCVSLIKNSSLAVAIGFPDLVSILNTTGNQSGHNIETMGVMIAVYLTLSLTVAAALNRYNVTLLTLEAQLP
ncbi:MAG TPA: ABC transporter permease subunit, partial [Gemmatimonadaceae bacterium]|nr:ABC transporter permease subunit [Gemmatimonadaceae bacterium]